MKMAAWHVYLRGREIDIVFFDWDMSKDQVLRALINHDGYPSNITVIKRAA